jgi:hypothetical protein
MIAFLILLVVALYIMSLFASGQKHWLRAQQYSIASFLVHGKMQEAMLIPLKELPTGRRRFDPPYEDFTYQVDFASYEGGSVLYTWMLKFSLVSALRLELRRWLATISSLLA